MDALRRPLARQLEPQQIKAIFQKTLALGVDLDNRGLHWRLSREYSPEQRLAFALAVYFSGGLYVLIDADRGFLCVERIAQKFARLTKAREHEAYSIGHAFADLHDALGYGHGETIGFSLIEDVDLSCPEGFVKGFSDCTRQSLEGDVMRVLKNGKGAGPDTLLNNLKHYIDDHTTVTTVARTFF